MANSSTAPGRALKAHIALNVRNVERSIEFYRRMLGIEPSKVRTRYAKFDVEKPPLNLTLNENAFDERGALSHLGIQVSSTDDVLSMRERWIERGLLPRDEMRARCCYAVQDKTWVSDPDGNEWEVFVVLEDNLPEPDRGASNCCSPGATKKDASQASTSGECEAASPPTGQSPCCETQAITFGISG